MLIPPEIHDIGAHELARLAVLNALKVCSSAEPIEAKKRALAALLVVPWTYSLAANVGSAHFIRLRKLCSSNPELYSLASTLRERINELHNADVMNIRAFGDDYRKSMIAWRRILLEGQLYTKARPHDWTAVLSALQEKAIRSPRELMNVPLLELHKLSPDNDVNSTRLLRLLWESAIVHDPISPFDHAHAALQGPTIRQNAFDLAKCVAGPSAHDSPVGTAYAARLDRIEEMAPGFCNAGPSQRMKLCARAQMTPADIACFQRSAVSLNIAKKASCSLNGVSSAIKAWGSFCDLNAIPHFPVDRARVIEWSAYFNDSATFSVYVAHLKTACFMQGVSVDWDTQALRAVSTGLKREGEKRRALKSAVTRDMLGQIISDFGLEAEFSLFATISWVFLLRALAECLPLRCAYPWEDLREGSPIDDNSDAVIGLRDDTVRIQLRRRKNARNGAVITRACTCGAKGSSGADVELHVPRTLCPVHRIWECIRKKCMAGKNIFPSLSLSKVNPTLRDVAARHGWPNPLSFGTHAFRRGGAQALAKVDAAYATICRAGQWKSNCATRYLNLADIETRTAARVEIAEGISSSSDDEPLA